MELEKAQIESAIVQITSQPFINRGAEKNGQSALQRIVSLEEKLIDRERQAKAIKEEELKKE
jgi:hypothetical protein